MGVVSWVPAGRPRDQTMRSCRTFSLLIWLRGLKRCWLNVRLIINQSAGSGLPNTESVTGMNCAACENSDGVNGDAVKMPRITAPTTYRALIMGRLLLVLRFREQEILTDTFRRRSYSAETLSSQLKSPLRTCTTCCSRDRGVSRSHRCLDRTESNRVRRDLAIDSVFGRSRRLGFGENQWVYHFAGSGSCGTAREWAATSNHNQLGDPAKGAAAIVAIAT